MRKILCVIIIIIGLAMIGTGMLQQFKPGLKLKSGIKEEINETQVKEENVQFESINKYNLDSVCSKDSLTSTYINTPDYSKISLDYPSCVHEYSLSFDFKLLYGDPDIRLSISVDKTSSNNYLNKKKTLLIALSNDYDYELHYTNIKTITNKNDLKVSFIQANYQQKLIFTVHNYDVWYIAVELEDNLILTFEFESKGNVISYESIMAMLDSIEYEKDAAIFSHSHIENGYQIGSIKQNFYKSYEHGYKLNYKVPVEYPEIDSHSTDINSALFFKENIDEKMYVSLSLKHDYYSDFYQLVENSRKTHISTYEEDKETYRNLKGTGIVEKIINDKKIYYYIYSFDYYINNKKVNTDYISEVYYELEHNTYANIYISNSDLTVDEKFISNFLNFTIEEY